MPTVHSKLREYRQKKQLTQEELAQHLGVTRQTINALEQSKYQPTLYLAYRCAQFFEVRIEDLFTFND